MYEKEERRPKIIEEKIAEIIYDGAMWVMASDDMSKKDCAKIAQQILPLLRQEGWLHKDDKAKGLNCTIGEVLEQVGEMVKGYEILEEAIKHKLHLLPGMFNFDLLINNALTLKSGERIREK